MKRFILAFALSALFVPLCTEASAARPKGATRAERILAELRDPQSTYVAVAAHRGDWRNFPENSLEAIESAIAMGVDIIEIDVKRTSDGVLVVCHDKTINRTTSGKGRVSEITYDSISRCCLRAGHGVRMARYRMPTLAEALDVCRDRVVVNVDHAWGYYDEIMELLRERGMAGQVIIKGKSPRAEIEEKSAGHAEKMLYMPIIDYTSRQWESSHLAIFEDFISSAVQPLAYEVCWNGTLEGERNLFGRIVKAGSRLWVNTLWDSLCGGAEHGLEDDRAVYAPEKIYGRVLELGTSIIQTDRPALLIGYLESVGRHTLRE